jgi:hypothetical protein
VRGEELPPVFRVQRSAGNAAAVEYVRRMKEGERFGGSIGGSATVPALQRQATETKKPPPKRILLTSGKQVDAFLAASTFFKTYTVGKMKKGITAKKSLKFHEPDAFKKQWMAYAVGRENPDTQKPYTQEEAKAKAERVSAFLIPEKDEVHINRMRAPQKTYLHETLHLFSDESGWIDVVRYHVNEGATEFFTEILCEETTMPFFTDFPHQLASVKRLVGISSREALADAYFKGKLEDIKKAVEAKGEGKWARWLGYMEAKKFTEADALLK